MDTQKTLCSYMSDIYLILVVLTFSKKRKRKKGKMSFLLGTQHAMVTTVLSQQLLLCQLTQMPISGQNVTHTAFHLIL